MSTYPQFARLVQTLAIGALGSVCAYILDIPAAMLAGALSSVALASIFGLPVAVDNRLRQTALVAVGALIGSSVSPETLDTIMVWPASTLLMLVSVGVMLATIPAYLVSFHSIDKLTARLATVPGALSYVMAIAEESNADRMRVAVLQTMRLASLMILFPVVVKLTLEPTTGLRSADEMLSATDFAILFGSCSAVAILVIRSNILAASFFSSMIMSSLLYGSGIVSGSVPNYIIWPALIVTGSAIGARFSGIDRHYLVQCIRMGLVTLSLSLIISLLFALPISFYFNLPIVQVWLAYAPGGIDTMTVLAFALGVNPAFVAGHQLVRLLCLSLAVPFLFRKNGSRKIRQN